MMWVILVMKDRKKREKEVDRELVDDDDVDDDDGDHNDAEKHKKLDMKEGNMGGQLVNDLD